MMSKLTTHEMMAEQQLLGYRAARLGDSVIQLIESMGLTKTEWDNIREHHGIDLSTSSFYSEVDDYLTKAALPEEARLPWLPVCSAGVDAIKHGDTVWLKSASGSMWKGVWDDHECHKNKLGEYPSYVARRAA